MWPLENFKLHLAATLLFLVASSVLDEGRHTSPVKSQVANILGFPGQTVVSVAATQLCCYSRKAARDDM